MGIQRATSGGNRVSRVRGCIVGTFMSGISPPWPCISIERSDVVSADGLDAWVDRCCCDDDDDDDDDDDVAGW